MKKIILVSLVVIAGCSNIPKQKGLVYYNDFEYAKGWEDVNLGKEPVHSGVYSNKMDSIHQYGATFKLPFKEVANGKVASVKISLWAYLEPNAKTSIVTEVRRPDQGSLLYQGYKLEDVIKEKNKWQEVEFTVPINDSLNKPDNIFMVYPWNLSKSNVYVDDVRIEFILGGF